MSINSVTVSGRLGADVELRTTGGGESVASLRIAVSAGKDSTVWLETTVWSKLAEVCAAHLKKGSFVVASGRLKDDSYTNKDGINITRTGMTAYAVEFGPKQDSGSTPQPAKAQAPAPVQDDLPF
jgi:single-strand DNA-binding protein